MSSVLTTKPITNLLLIKRVFRVLIFHGACSCEGMDSVSISVLIDSEPHNLGVYCGSKQPPMLMSNNNHMEVIFTAVTGPTAATGFSATYNFVTGELSDIEKCTQTACENHSNIFIDDTYTKMT